MYGNLNPILDYPENRTFSPICHASYEHKVEVVCYICGKPMKPTSKHFLTSSFHRRLMKLLFEKSKQPPSSGWRRYLERHAPWTPVNPKEFDNLHPVEAIHCESCFSDCLISLIKNSFPFLFLSVFAIGGVFILGTPNALFYSALKIVVFLTALFLFGLTWGLSRNSRLILPVIGRTPKIKISEKIEAPTQKSRKT
jgi:hypothetical protein